MFNNSLLKILHAKPTNPMETEDVFDLNILCSIYLEEK